MRRVWNFLLRENLHRLLLLIGVVVAGSSIGITFLEPGMLLPNAFWWSIVTLTTVGYGDISPVTTGGRIIAVIIMFSGIGLLGMFSATIASVLVEKKMKEDRGMTSYQLKDHVIICEWNHRARSILDQLRADPQTKRASIVLIADIERKPVNDENLCFIQGDVSDETLKRANIDRARTAVILGDDRLEATARDAKVVMNTLTVESINPEVYTIVELVDEAHVRHCERANANEIIVTSDLGAGLISRAALNHGITKVVSELLSSHYGNELYKLSVPEFFQGRQFIDVLLEMKQRCQSILLAVQKGEEGEFISNPPADYRFEPNDYLIIIAPERPSL